MTWRKPVTWREKNECVRTNFIKIIKISIGCCVSVFLADVAGLQSSTSAGVMTLLSIQNTKKETLRVAAKRFAAFGVAFVVSYPIFHFAGYRITSFGIFLFLFVLICYYLDLHDGISMNTVLVTHFFAARSMGPAMIVNEFSLLCIGIGIGVIINFYMPKKIDLIRSDQRFIDSSLRNLLYRIAEILAGNKDPLLHDDFIALQQYTKQALRRAHENRDNTLTSDMQYYVQYTELRMAQLAILQRMGRSFSTCVFLPAHSLPVSRLIRKTADSLREYGNAAELLDELAKLKLVLHAAPLPGNHVEFENRAALHQILSDLEYFLSAKKRFAESLTEWQIRTFWPQMEIPTAASQGSNQIQ